MRLGVLEYPCQISRSGPRPLRLSGAPGLTLCRASHLAEARCLSSPLPSPWPDERRASSMPLRPHLHHLQLRQTALGRRSASVSSSRGETSAVWSEGCSHGVVVGTEPQSWSENTYCTSHVLAFKAARSRPACTRIARTSSATCSWASRMICWSWPP